MKENTPGFRIKQLTALVAVDEDGDEGIPAIQGPNGILLPCIGADQKRLDDFLIIAREMVKIGRCKEIKVMQFTDGKVIEVINKQSVGEDEETKNR